MYNDEKIIKPLENKRLKNYFIKKVCEYFNDDIKIELLTTFNKLINDETLSATDTFFTEIILLYAAKVRKRQSKFSNAIIWKCYCTLNNRKNPHTTEEIKEVQNKYSNLLYIFEL